MNPTLLVLCLLAALAAGRSVPVRDPKRPTGWTIERALRCPWSWLAVRRAYLLQLDGAPRTFRRLDQLADMIQFPQPGHGVMSAETKHWLESEAGSIVSIYYGVRLPRRFPRTAGRFLWGSLDRVQGVTVTHEPEPGER